MIINPVVLNNTIAFIFFGLAGIVLAVRWRDAQLSPSETIPLFLALLLYAFITFSNTLEHAGISSYFDSSEDIAEVVFLFVCILFVNNYRLQKNLKLLRSNQAELSAALENISEQEEQYRLLVESAKDAILIAQDDKIKFCNSRTHDLLGYSIEEIYSTPFLKFIHPEDQTFVLNYHERRIKKDETLPSTFKVRAISKDGRELTVQINSVFIEWKKLPATLNFVRDITDQVKLEQNLHQAQKMESIGTLAGGIAHDFNNILTAIMGYGELALDQAGGGGDNSDKIVQIIRGAERARDLVKKILTFSRKAETDLQPLNLNREIREAVGLLESTIPKMVTVDTILASNLWPVSADTTQIQQLLVNLAANASDAMPQGGQLSFETSNLIADDTYSRQYPEVEPGHYVLLQVSDTGQGMDEQTRHRIFEPFYTTKGLGKGTGLGLATVYGIVKGHHGHIACYSEPGLGTTFRVILPAQADQDAALDEQAATAAAVSGGDERILLVDDEKAIRWFCKQMLDEAGYQVQTADSGEKALDIYRNEGKRLDLVILDLGMPGMGGLKCMQEILAQDPEARVIITSGYSADGHIKKCLDQGAAGFVPKPYRRDDLLSKLRAVLDKTQRRLH